MATCRLCASVELSPKALPSFDICTECARTLGVVPLGPPARPARPCNRCNGMKFVRVVPRELSATGDDHPSQQAAPMTLTIAPTITENILFRGNTTQAPNVWNGRGRVETYVCTGCGFMEWYCLDFKSIPIGPEYMADIVDYSSDNPYR